MTETGVSTPLSPEQVLDILAASSGGGSPLPRHRHNLTPQQVEESQRWRLLAATAEVIANNGYAQTSVDQIAAQASVSKTSFYKIFDDKESAFLAAYDTMGLVLAGLNNNMQATAPDLETLVRGGISEYVRLLQAAPAFARMFLLRVHGSTTKIMDRRIQNVALAAGALQFLVDQSGLEYADLTHADFVALIGAITETLMQQVHRSGVETLGETVDPLVTFTLRVLSA